ncbi:MAG: hypothetical protein JSU65_12740 [Candidatus Zixiibacteriota bacterium]|nr:MAG: hypothetical protein JSU65_12740 [candidate division Zixibacteria bacterium]
MKGKVANLRFVNHILIALCLLLTVLVQAGQSQDVANGQATATVQAALVVTATNNLIFGNVLQGVAKTVANNVDANSGQFAITGQGSAGISVYLTLPTYMALADGSDRMNIAFSNTDAIVDTTVATPSTAGAGDGWVDINPRDLNSLAPTGVVVGMAGQTNIYLGGKVTPAVDQKAGAYTADIICSVAYNGT